MMQKGLKTMDKPFVYADNAATTNVSDNALNAMLPYLKEQYGNPSSIYTLGMDAAKAVLNARRQVAEALDSARPSEIFFTSGGSEADNLAIKSAAEFGTKNGKRHIITTNIEHHAVLHTCEYLADHGFEVTYLPADEDGIITAEQVENAIREDTLTMFDIQKRLDIASRSFIQMKMLKPAIEQGYVLRAFPDKPSHPKQRYYLSEKGLKLVK